ncbi:hypothetical protein [Amycolatopsis australiensis]|uniref:hypothetical protein n=1 Tax=Amycolatopsis australiensis TaxID=546364 RepID=UPI0011610A5F|nr:hypothetical protein [Amycolatopsis australiensis]
MHWISYWEAWQVWWSGKKLDDSTVFMQLSTVTWARIGKLLEFAGGLTVLLDLAGQDRIQQYVRAATIAFEGLLDWEIRRFVSFVDNFARTVWIVAEVSMMAALATALNSQIITVTTIVLGVIVILINLLNLLTRQTMLVILLIAPALIYLLKGERTWHPVRWLAFLLFLIGFHFDLLTS